MRFIYSRKFKKLFQKLPTSIQDKFSKQLELFERDFKHPSLHVKRIRGTDGIWEARVDYRYRFTFNWEADLIFLRVIGAHDAALNNP